MIAAVLPLTSIVAWVMALGALILGLYTLTLNFRQYINRLLSLLFLFMALSLVATGQLLHASIPMDAEVAARLAAATTLPLGIPLLWVTIALLQPTWLTGRARVVDRLFKVLIAFFPALVLVDSLFGTRLWYGGLPATYTGGYVPPTAYVTGVLSRLAFWLNLFPVLSLLVSVYTALLAKTGDRGRRSLAWVLLATQALALVNDLLLRDVWLTEVLPLVGAGLFLAGYGYVVFARIMPQIQRSGHLQTRLTALVLVITIPLLVGSMLLLGQQSSGMMMALTNQQLQIAAEGLEQSLRLWQDLNYNILEQLAAHPAIVSMDPELQRPQLQALAEAFPYMYLVSTTDLQGMNVARNDELDLVDYSDRAWFRTARTGLPGLQVVQGRTGLAPALVLAVPIRTETRQIVGVAMFATRITAVSQLLRAAPVGTTGEFFVVDDANVVLLHSRAADFTEVQDYSDYPPVVFARRSSHGALAYTDAAGERWQAYAMRMSNGWIVVFQLQYTELQQPINDVRRVNQAVVLAGLVLLTSLILLAYRQAFRPIGLLTAAATEIAAGAIDRTVLVESTDELGVLANAFNAMTAQLRTLIGSLESQVQARTRDVERRARYLEAAAEVSRATASLTETAPLLQQAVQLIQEHFDLYYVGLFLVDAAGEWAELRAATGAAGAAMLARNHRLKVGPGSMIGWCVENAEARVALEAGADGVRLATVELPDTRSEAALPVRSRGRVIGAISVQHVEAGAFDADAIAALQVMADQLGAALDNAILLEQSHLALDEVQRAYGEVRGAAWRRLLSAREAWGYRYAGQEVTAVAGDWSPEMLAAAHSGQSIVAHEEAAALLAVPLAVRGQRVGVLHFRRAGRTSWTSEERSTLELLVERLSEALEGAQLYQETQQRAAREQLVAGVTTRMRETLDIETVLKTAASEMRQALALPELSVRLLRLDE